MHRRAVDGAARGADLLRPREETLARVAERMGLARCEARRHGHGEALGVELVAHRHADGGCAGGCRCGGFIRRHDRRHRRRWDPLELFED